MVRDPTLAGDRDVHRRDAEIHAWRHRGIQGNYTLHITREVLDRNDPNALPEMLDEWNAEAALRGMTNGDVVLRYVAGRLTIRHFSPPT
jgi:hypothetical protein